jgi:hypothetical protein
VAVPRTLAHLGDGGDDRLRVGLGEEHAGGVLDDGLEVPAVVQRRHRATGRRRLEHGEPEVLARRRHQPDALLVAPAQLAVVEEAEHGHVVAGLGQHVVALGTDAHHDEALVGQLRERLAHRVDVLVREQAAHDEEEAGRDPVHGLGRRVERGGGRMDDLRVDAVVAFDVPVRHARVGEVARRRARRVPIPAAQRRGHHREHGACGLVPLRVLVAEVLLPLREPPRDRVAVDDLRRGGAHAVGPAAGAAHDHVGVDVHGRERGREERERGPVVLAEERHPVEGAGAHVDVAELGIGHVGRVERRVERCVGERARELERDALGAAELGEVVVHEGDARSGGHRMAPRSS